MLFCFPVAFHRKLRVWPWTGATSATASTTAGPPGGAPARATPRAHGRSTRLTSTPHSDREPAGAFDEPESEETRFDDFDRLEIDVSKRSTGLGDVDAFLLRLQDDLVNLLLGGRIGAADRVRSRDVPRHIAKVACGVHQQQLARI